MTINDDIATIRKDIGGVSQKFFISFFSKYGQHMNEFKDYKGKTTAQLSSVPSFSTHPEKVVTMLLKVVEVAGDSGKLAAQAKVLKQMPEHTNLNAQHFQDMFTALVPFLQETLGSCDAGAWQSAGQKIVAALKTAGF